MKKVTYRLASVFPDFVSDNNYFETHKYKEAFLRAVELMRSDPWIQSILIYSNKPSAIVLKSSTTLPRYQNKI